MDDVTDLTVNLLGFNWKWGYEWRCSEKNYYRLKPMVMAAVFGIHDGKL